jgi:hypothetical protein
LTQTKWILSRRLYRENIWENPRVAVKMFTHSTAVKTPKYPQGYGAKLLLAFTKKVFQETFLKIRIFQQSSIHFSGLNI